MFTGLVVSDKNSVLSTMLARVSAALQQELPDKFNQITFSFHFFPDNWDGDSRTAQRSGLVSGLFKPDHENSAPAARQADHGYRGKPAGAVAACRCS